MEPSPLAVSLARYRLHSLSRWERGSKKSLCQPFKNSPLPDTGFTPDEKNLRAPGIAVGNIPDEPGWAPGAPPLAVEYADTGQDERDLQQKIGTLLGAGTRYVWVVRLT